MSRYDDTPVSPDEAVEFVPGVGFALKADLDAAEDAALTAVLATILDALDDGVISVADLLLDGQLRELHRTAFEGIWAWAGRQRSLETSVGVAPGEIAMQVASTHADLRAMAASGMPPRELAMTAHWRMVRVHPFVDGNGRITRLYADAILFGSTGVVFDWQDGEEYYAALRDADRTMDVRRLLDLVPDLSADDLA